MESYEIITDVYRIPGGFGNSGEIYGGIFLNDSPGIVINASGGMKFVRNLQALLNNLDIKEFRVYLTVVTLEEINTISLIQKYLPQAAFYIHSDIAKKIQNPREFYMQKRFDPSLKDVINSYTKKLPKKINNVYHINKMSSFTTKKTKILIVPFAGPHEGHTFIYSRNHRLLNSGVVLGYTPSNSRSYYLDFTGSVSNYRNALSFLKQAQADVVAPAYDEPQFTKSQSINTSEILSAIESDQEASYELCSLQWKSYDVILQEYRQIYGTGINVSPYEDLKMDATILRFHLSELIKDGKILEENNRYRRA